MFTFVVTSGATAAYTIDTARTGLGKLEDDSVLPDGAETRAWPNQVAHFDDRPVPGVRMEDGATQFLVEGIDQPVVAARPLAHGSLTWSPSKSRLTYAGKLDACKILREAGGAGRAGAAGAVPGRAPLEKPDPAQEKTSVPQPKSSVPQPKTGAPRDKNELYVYDKTKRTAQRIAAAVSPFGTLWLDDDRLVYEGGVGKDGKIHLYTFSTHSDEALPTRHGAGLYGVPTLACEQAESGVEEEQGDEESLGD